MKDQKELKPFCHRCEWCGYTAKDSEFISGYCPACCADNITGEIDTDCIPTVFYEEYKEYMP